MTCDILPEFYNWTEPVARKLEAQAVIEVGKFVQQVLPGWGVNCQCLTSTN